MTQLLSTFLAPNVPEGYRSQFINGFVEELVVNDDPEYQWIDKIRTPRASNEVKIIISLYITIVLSVVYIFMND